MKKLVLFALTIVSIGCSSDNTYTKIQIETFGTNPTKDSYESIFTVSEPDEMAIQEITDQSGTFNLTFDNTGTNGVSMVNTKIKDNKPEEWRTKKGHDIKKIETDDKLVFVLTNPEASSRATITYTK